MLSCLWIERYCWWLRSQEVGEGTLCQMLHCQHQNDFCIKTNSNDSHFNSELITRGKVTRRCPRTKSFERTLSRTGDSNRTHAVRLPALPLFQTCSHTDQGRHHGFKCEKGWEKITRKAKNTITKAEFQTAVDACEAIFWPSAAT